MTSAGIGAKLHDARERAGLSLREVSEHTKIPTCLLQAIERNDASKLPGGLYSRGYVRSFAIAVSLDPETTVAEFVAHCPEGSVKNGYPAAERAAMAELQQQKRAKASTAGIRARVPVLRRAALGGIPAVLVIYLGANGLPSWPAAGRNPEVRHAGVAEMFGGAAPSDETAPSPRTSAPPTAVDPLPSRFMEVRAEAIAVPPPAPTTAVASLAAPAAVESMSSPSSDPVAIVLTASSPSWVIAMVDGRRAVNRLFEPGSQETLEAKRDLTLTIGDAGAVAMTLNGRPARPLGRAGEPATAYVTNANFRNYLRR